MKALSAHVLSLSRKHIDLGVILIGAHRSATDAVAAMNIRRATIEDLLQMQNANIMNLPENYNQKYCECGDVVVGYAV